MLFANSTHNLTLLGLQACYHVLLKASHGLMSVRNCDTAMHLCCQNSMCIAMHADWRAAHVVQLAGCPLGTSPSDLIVLQAS